MGESVDKVSSNSKYGFAQLSNEERSIERDIRGRNSIDAVPRLAQAQSKSVLNNFYMTAMHDGITSYENAPSGTVLSTKRNGLNRKTSK